MPTRLKIGVRGLFLIQNKMEIFPNTKISFFGSVFDTEKYCRKIFPNFNFLDFLGIGFETYLGVNILAHAYAHESENWCLGVIFDSWQDNKLIVSEFQNFVFLTLIGKFLGNFWDRFNGKLIHQKIIF